MENEVKNKYKKILKFLFNYMNILIFVSLYYGFFMIRVLGQKPLSHLFFIIVIAYTPILILLILKYVMYKFKKKWVVIVSNIFGTIFVFFYVLYIILGTMALGFASGISDINLFDTKTPAIEEYYDVMSNTTDKPYQIKHFPVKIPEKAYNYYCERENDPRGFNIHYVKFNIDDKYLNEIIKQNQKNINEKINMADINQYYRYIDLRLKLEDEEKYDAYILKNENSDDTYTSGFVISKEKHEIIFFYANYNLKN